MPVADKEMRKQYNKEYYQNNKEKFNNNTPKCEYNRQKSRCKECGGSEICEHNRVRGRCKDCGGASFCEHNRRRNTCKDCGGGCICQHHKIRSKCIECGGGSICEHDMEKRRCKKCNFHSYLVNLQRYHLWRCLQHSNIERTKPSIEYLGCDATYFKKYIESKFIEGMSWDNIHLDHIKPIKEFNLDDNIELLKCCHYSNFQPLLEYDNKLKSNKWSKEDNKFWLKNITDKEYIPLYIPK